MLPTERLDYSAIPERRPLMLPGGARLAVWVIVNVEEWDPKETMPRTVLTPPAGGAPMPDIPNWAWHEYGNRVGFWRMLEVFDDCHIPAVLAINGSAIHRYGAIVKAARERQWEFIGHGFSQKNMQKVADERDDIRKTSAAIREATGRNPRGWLGPGLTETWETPDLLAEAGYDYVCDWVLDDEPTLLKTRQADCQPALHAGMQRRRDDADPASQGERVPRPRRRPVRPALRRCAALRARHGARRAPLHHGCAAPPQIFPQRPRAYPEIPRRRVLDRRADPRLVPRAATLTKRPFEHPRRRRQPVPPKSPRHGLAGGDLRRFQSGALHGNPKPGVRRFFQIDAGLAFGCVRALHRLGYDGDNMIARIEAVFDPRIIGEGDSPVTVGDADDVSRISVETRLNEPVGNIGTDALAVDDTPFTDKSRADNPVFFPLRTSLPIDRDVVRRMVTVEILVVGYLSEPQIRTRLLCGTGSVIRRWACAEAGATSAAAIPRAARPIVVLRMAFLHRILHVSDTERFRPVSLGLVADLSEKNT
jgi:hypothetical protein